MPYFVSLINWTDQGARNVKDSGKRLAAARTVIERSGARIHAVYYTFGRYDMVGIIEATNDESMARIALSLASQGNLRMETLKAFSESEAGKIFESLP